MLEQEKTLTDVTPSKSDILRIKVGNSINEIDLSGLNESQRAELMMRYANMTMDAGSRYINDAADIEKLNHTLGSVTTNVEEATQAGVSATVSHVETTSTGKTEFMIGNTDKAAIGKLSRSMTGDNDNLIKLVIIIAITVIVVTFILGRS